MIFKINTKNLFFLFFLIIAQTTNAQDIQIDIEDKLENNRLLIYAVNKNLFDVDVAIEVDGFGFKKREQREIFYRLPATSKINITTLIVERGKQAVYNYKLKVNDSLSRRVRQVPFELIKIDPKKPITVYLPSLCAEKCDTLVNSLSSSPYIFKAIKIEEDQNIKTQLEKSLVGGADRLANMDTPIVMLGGKMYVQIENYEQLMARLNEEEE